MAKKKEEAAEGAEEGAEGGKKKFGIKLPALGGKLPLIGGAVAAVLLLGGGGWWFFLRAKPQAAQVAQAPTAADPRQPAGAPAPGGPRKPAAFLDLPELTVNLAAGGQQDRQQFLRMKIALEVQEQKVVTDIQPMLPRVLDTFQVYMRELRPQDLEGSAGLYRLKEELTRRVNVAVFPSRVEAVLFKELMVQ
ncbi:MAG: flagellar basal body-associated FliL family protein [Beijerinckiaceae bacterium]